MNPQVYRNVLVTCGGKWAGLLLQLRDAMARLPIFQGAKLVVASSDSFTPAGCFADVTHVVPLIRDPAYVDRLLAVCRAENIGVIVPLLDLDLERLAAHHAVFAAAGVALVCPTPELVELSIDKLRFARFATEHGLRVVTTWLYHECDHVRFPLFYKRRRGFGSIGSGVCDTLAMFQKLAAADSALIFQPVVDAPEISVDAYIARSGICTVCVPRLREKVVAGESYKSRTIDDPPVTSLARATIGALARAGLRGPINLQIFATDPPQLLELNARLGSASVLGNTATAGRLFTSLLAEAAGETAQGDPDDYIRNLALARFLGDVFHQERRVVSIQPAWSPR